MAVLRSSLAAAVALAAGLGAGVSRADEPPPRVIRYAGDTLSVHLAQVPLSDVLGEIGRQSGAGIQGGLRTPHDVSAEFDDVPLPEALHRLLGDQNFALVYGEHGRLRTVKLLGGPQAAPSAAVVASAPTTTLPTQGQTDPSALIGLVASHPPVPVTGRLADALGTQNASVQQILEASLHNDDAAVRSEAIRRSLSLVEAEPDLRTAVLGAVKSMDDASLAGLIRSASPGHAEELVVHIATQARVSELRVKASGVLQQLRAPAQRAGG